MLNSIENGRTYTADEAAEEILERLRDIELSFDQRQELEDSLDFFRPLMRTRRNSKLDEEAA